jgi:hypothetical protein
MRKSIGDGEWQRLLRSRWIDEPPHSRDAIGRDTDFLRVFPDQSFVGSEVHAIDLVAGDVALQPLNFGAHLPENLNGFAREFLDFGVRKISGSGDFPLDDKLRHVVTSVLCHGSRRVDMRQGGRL